MGGPMTATVTNHGTAYGYKKGCRCEDCKAAAATTRNAARARRRAGGVNQLDAEPGTSTQFVFGFTCPNCGSACEHQNSSRPHPDLNARSTALVRCCRTGCNRTWQLIVTVVNPNRDGALT